MSLPSAAADLTSAGEDAASTTNRPVVSSAEEEGEEEAVASPGEVVAEERRMLPEASESRSSASQQHKGMLRAQARVTPANLATVSGEFVEEFLVAARDLDAEKPWKSAKAVQEVQIWTRPCLDSSIDMSRGRLRFARPAAEGWAQLVDSTHLRYVDNYYKESRIVKRFDDVHTLVHYRYSMPFPMYARDFTVLEVNRPLEDGVSWIAIACSIHAEDEIPLDVKNYVRGAIFASGYLVERDPSDPENACFVTSVTHCDPGGSIPKKLVNTDAKTQPSVLARIKLLIEKGKKTYHAKSKS